MNKLMAVLKALGSTARSAKRRALPVDEEQILKAVRDAIAEGGFSGRKFGYTFDPAAGRFLEAGDDFGYMMSQVPERTGLNRVASEADIEELIKDPYYMEKLRRGDYIGGWPDEITDEAGNVLSREFVIDPSTRFMSKPKSIVRGAPARQKAGFDLRNIDEYRLDPEMIQAAQERIAAQRALAIMLGSPAAAGGMGLAYKMAQD